MMDAINLKNYFFYFASFVIIIAGVKMASEVVVILFLAIFISSIFSSVLNLLKNRKIPKIISYLLLVLIVLIVGFMFVYVINISLKDFLTNLPLYEEKLRNLVLNSIHLMQSYGFQIEIDRAKIMEVLNFGSFFCSYKKYYRKYWSFFISIFIGNYWSCIYSSRVKIFSNKTKSNI